MLAERNGNETPGFAAGCVTVDGFGNGRVECIVSEIAERADNHFERPEAREVGKRDCQHDSSAFDSQA